MNSKERLRKKADKLNLKSIKRHIFLCADQTNPKCCKKEIGLKSWEFLKKRLGELNLDGQGGYLPNQSQLPESMQKGTNCRSLSGGNLVPLL